MRSATSAGYSVTLLRVKRSDVSKLRMRLRFPSSDPNRDGAGSEHGREGSCHRFPTSVRAAVLDGPPEPSATIFGINVRQTKGFEQSFHQYAKGCADRSACHNRLLVVGTIHDAATRTRAPLPSPESLATPPC